jgi:hypothetical protein
MGESICFARKSASRNVKEEGLVQLPGQHDRAGPTETNPAFTELGETAEQIGALLERAQGVGWYEDTENDVDAAVVALCRLRRAGAGARGHAEAGDAAVRDALAGSSLETVVWLASRTISYMDEHGFPELVRGERP